MRTAVQQATDRGRQDTQRTEANGVYILFGVVLRYTKKPLKPLQASLSKNSSSPPQTGGTVAHLYGFSKTTDYFSVFKVFLECESTIARILPETWLAVTYA